MKNKQANTFAKKICVIGTWHLGCVVSACLANLGNKVWAVDFNKNIISNLQKGVPPLYEPGLQKLIKKNINKRNLFYVHDFQTALRDADYIFITFDTPVNKKDKSNLKPIFQTCGKIASYTTSTNPYIVVSSQIPIGTSRELKKLILRKNPKLVPDIIYNPENLRLGKAIDTFTHPDRIVIGVEKESSAKKLLLLYKKFKSPKFVMSLESAEMVKHALNSYLATSISFINEIANLCEGSSANVQDVIKALKSDKRIGEQAFLNPGLGFAGGTLARDLQVLLSLGKKIYIKTNLVQATLEVNRNRIKHILQKLKKSFPRLRNLKGGILGLTYKPGTSTLRRSASIELAKEMIQKGIKIKAYDPMISKHIKNGSFKDRIQLCKTPYEVAKKSQFLIIATEWPEFKNLDFTQIYKLMDHKNSRLSSPVLIDTKNMLDPSLLVQKGFKYLGTGLTLK